MSIIIPANSAVAGGYDVENSCRFDGTAAYLNRTQGTSTNLTKFAWSGWIKRSKLGADQTVTMNYASASNYGYFYFRSGDDIRIFDRGAGGDTVAISDMLFRDTSAWYHIALIIDTTQATDTNRLKLYVNGILQGLNGVTYPVENAALGWKVANTSNTFLMKTNSADGYVGGYLAEVAYVDGTANAITDFGEFDEDSEIWKPIDVSGLTFGNEGYYLDFKDSANLGNDVTGGTDFTENSLAAIDQTQDTCTNNFCTMNSLDAYWSASTFEDGNCTIIMPETTNETYTRATMGVNSGKWYWEALCTVQNSTMNAGIVDSPAIATNTELGKRPKGLSWNDSGSLNGNDTQVFNSTQAPAYSTSQIISFAMDLDNNFLYLRLAGSYTNSGNPESGASGTGGAAIPTNPSSGFYFPAFGDSSTSGGRYQVNFGNSPFAISSGNTDGNDRGNFEYTVPSGYLALCTKNLSEANS